MSKLSEKRKEARHILDRRRDIGKTIGEKVEVRRSKREEQRELKAKLRDKLDRNPDSQRRVDQLEAQCATLHAELIDLAGDLERLSNRLHELRPRRHRLSQRLKRLRRRIQKMVKSKHGPDAAIRAAEKDNGKHEEPPGSNWGPYVSKVIKFTGYSGPVYWCGCAACWWMVRKAGGVATARIRRGYAGYVAADARAGTNGLKAVPDPVRGGWGTLWGYEHIVMTTGRVDGLLVETWEGNTSATNGSQSNGGEVANKWRPRSDFDIFAAQTYWAKGARG